MSKTFSCLAVAIVLVSCVAAAYAAPQQNDLQFTLELRDGSRLVVETANTQLPWKTVEKDGQTSSRSIDLKDVAVLDLALMPASNQVAEIRRLVTQLADSAYYRRHQAERALMEKGGPFMVVISQAQEHREPEVRYRVKRLLEYLEDQNEKDPFNKSDVEFDVVTLNSGDTLEGDIANWKLDCRWQGRDIQLGRDKISSIRRDTVPATESAFNQQQEIQIESLVGDGQFFKDIEDAAGIKSFVPADGVTHVSFDTGPNDEALSSDREFAIDEFFTYLGCLLECENERDSRVYISNFRFKQGRSRVRSIGNFYIDPGTEDEVSYQGVMKVSFCDKDQPRIPATVNLVGLYLEIVHPRHTIVEAYNDAGHLIATTEATRNRSSFTGFNSNVPIAFLRIRANSELVLPESETLNQDFAVDDLCFGELQVCNSFNPTENYLVIGQDGQRIHSAGAEFGDGKITLTATTVDGGDLELPVESLDWYHGPEKSRRSISDAFFVMLKDGSVVLCKMDDELHLANQSDVTISMDDVAGLWGGNIQARYPREADFDQGKFVVAQSTRRIAFENVSVEPLDSSIHFNVASGKTIEPAVIDSFDEPLPDDVTELDATTFAESVELTRAPSTWFSFPVQPDAAKGLLRTHDGEQYVLGGASGFAFKSVNADGIVITRDSKDITIPGAQVKSFKVR